jgi:hypothetical protein
MNAYEKDLSVDLAVLRYGDGEMTVVKPGRFVLCAVSGKRIAVDELKYWNPTLQEAYAGPAEALKRWRQLNPAPSEGSGA